VDASLFSVRPRRPVRWLLSGRPILDCSLRWGRTGFDLGLETNADMPRMMVGLVKPSIKSQMLTKQMIRTATSTPCSLRLRTS